MCTAVSYKTKCHYFGRNLDLERGFDEGVVITPRNFFLNFRYIQPLACHYALIGMAAVVNDYPLYFEATNEKGLSIAGLNFPENAFYRNFEGGKNNIAPFELIPYILGVCCNTEQAEKELESVNIVNCNFSESLPVSPLHWIISDKEKSVTLECTKSGMKIYDNPFGVLTNNPVFDFHLNNICNFQQLHPGVSENRLCKDIPLENYSLGLGAMGLPGDFSSASRFVKAVFVKENSVCDGTEQESVSQFFHILQSVAMPKGCVKTFSGEDEYTRYSSCCNTDTQKYYYTTYLNMTVRCIDMYKADLDGNKLCFSKVDE